ncbi:MAG: DUF3836 domain-containing protein [Sporocytophaga sp.]|nr:DUF3836 domain-containing protein [Sporocytophaga sp.]
MIQKLLCFLLSVIFFQIGLIYTSLGQKDIGINLFSNNILKKKLDNPDQLRISGNKITLDSIILGKVNKMYFEYDENYNQRTIIQIMIDGRAKFELNDSITTSYYWDFNQSIWIIAGQSKSKTESNNEGDIVSRSQYSRSNSEESWEPGTRTEFYYNSAGNILSESIFRWDPNSPQWAPSQKNEYTYNEFGNELSISRSVWNATSSQWELYNKKEKVYDENQNIITEIFSSYSINNLKWTNEVKYEYTYDENGNGILRLDFEWDLTSNNWKEIPSSKLEFTYDLTVLAEDIIMPVQNMPGKNKQVSAFLTNYNIFDESYPIYFYYSDDVVSGLPSVSKSDSNIIIYPNPASDFIQLKNFPNTSNISLLDITGRTFNFNLVDDKIDISSLNPGIYTLFIDQNAYKILKK